MVDSQEMDSHNMVANDEKVGSSTQKNRSPRKFDFPFKLHKLLDFVETTRQEHVICWHKSGEGFRIHNPKALEEVIMPSFYGHTKYKSFVRQLNIYGFKRIRDRRSELRWCYHHQYFIRGKPKLCRFMKRVKVLGSGSRTKNKKSDKNGINSHSPWSTSSTSHENKGGLGGNACAMKDYQQKCADGLPEADITKQELIDPTILREMVVIDAVEPHQSSLSPSSLPPCLPAAEWSIVPTSSAEAPSEDSTLDYLFMAILGDTIEDQATPQARENTNVATSHSDTFAGTQASSSCHKDCGGDCCIYEDLHSIAYNTDFFDPIPVSLDEPAPIELHPDDRLTILAL